MKSEPFPTLLNKSDAMLYAADTLERMCANIKLLSLLSDAFSKPRPDDKPLSQESKDALAEMNTAARGIVDADLQEKAMRAAAAEIRAMANETKLVEARAAQNDFTKNIKSTA